MANKHARTPAGGTTEPTGRQNANITSMAGSKQAANNRTLPHTSAPLVNASSDASARDVRELTASAQFLPHKASECSLCAMCKRGDVTGKASKKCKSACHLCPGVVTVGAESVLNIEIDGIVSTQYVRLATTDARGRALQGGLGLNGVEAVHTATSWFEGRVPAFCAYMDCTG